MKLHKMTDGPAKGYTTWGCIWDKGKYGRDTAYVCRDQAGNEVPVQSRITAFWPDGTVKWTAHTAKAEALGDEIEVMPVLPGEQLNGTTETVRKGIKLTYMSDKIAIDAGAIRVLIDKG